MLPPLIMDKMIGKDLETVLATLKTILEASEVPKTAIGVEKNNR